MAGCGCGWTRTGASGAPHGRFPSGQGGATRAVGAGRCRNPLPGSSNLPSNQRLDAFHTPSAPLSGDPGDRPSHQGHPCGPEKRCPPMQGQSLANDWGSRPLRTSELPRGKLMCFPVADVSRRYWRPGGPWRAARRGSRPPIRKRHVVEPSNGKSRAATCAFAWFPAPDGDLAPSAHGPQSLQQTRRFHRQPRL